MERYINNHSMFSLDSKLICMQHESDWTSESCPIIYCLKSIRRETSMRNVLHLSMIMCVLHSLNSSARPRKSDRYRRDLDPWTLVHDLWLPIQRAPCRWWGLCGQATDFAQSGMGATISVSDNLVTSVMNYHVLFIFCHILFYAIAIILAKTFLS